MSERLRGHHPLIEFRNKYRGRHNSALGGFRLWDFNLLNQWMILDRVPPLIVQPIPYDKQRDGEGGEKLIWAVVKEAGQSRIYSYNPSIVRQRIVKRLLKETEKEFLKDYVPSREEVYTLTGLKIPD